MLHMWLCIDFASVNESSTTTTPYSICSLKRKTARAHEPHSHCFVASSSDRRPAISHSLPVGSRDICCGRAARFGYPHRRRQAYDVGLEGEYGQDQEHD